MQLHCIWIVSTNPFIIFSVWKKGHEKSNSANGNDYKHKGKCTYPNDHLFFCPYQVYTHFMWNDPPQPYDAFYSVLYQLWRRRGVVRYSPHPWHSWTYRQYIHPPVLDGAWHPASLKHGHICHSVRVYVDVILDDMELCWTNLRSLTEVPNTKCLTEVTMTMTSRISKLRRNHKLN